MTDLADYASPAMALRFALERAARGSLTKSGSHYLDQGRPVPAYIAPALDTAIKEQLVDLADADNAALQRIALTDAGAARLTELQAPGGTA